MPARSPLLLVLALAGLLLGVGGWVYSDHVESENDFCTSCHLTDGTPLHREIREDFDRLIPHDLGGVHGRAFLDRREDDPAFRCIDCHASAGVLGRTRVKLLAAKDAVRYAAGRFQEPEGMPWPLPARLCLGCHADLRNAAAPGWADTAFHGITGHEVAAAEEASVSCVDCHGIHEREGDAFAYFLGRERIESQCARCHADLPGR